MKSLGVDIRVPPARRAAPTACCYILITPDGERTMQTYLGACTELGPDDVTERTVGSPKVVLLEGYVWDIPQGPAALDEGHAARGAQRCRRRYVAVGRRVREPASRRIPRRARTATRAMVFANEREIMRLIDVVTFDAAVAEASRHDAIFVLTRSEKGSVIVDREREDRAAGAAHREAHRRDGRGRRVHGGIPVRLDLGPPARGMRRSSARAAPPASSSRSAPDWRRTS